MTRPRFSLVLGIMAISVLALMSVVAIAQAAPIYEISASNGAFVLVYEDTYTSPNFTEKVGGGDGIYEASFSPDHPGRDRLIYFSATGAGYHWTDVQDAPYYTSWAHFGYPQPLTDLGVNWYWSLGRPVPEGMTYQTVILDTWSNYTQTLVPIPPTALLLGSGLLGLGAVRRFRKG